MKVNLGAFNKVGLTPTIAPKVDESTVVAPSARSEQETAKVEPTRQEPLLDHAEPPEALAAHGSSRSVAPPSGTPVFTRAHKRQNPDPRAEPETQEPEVAQPVPKTSKSRRSALEWLGSLRKVTAKRSDDEPISAAKEPNRNRLVIVAAVLVVVGAIVGPWLAQTTVPPQQVAAGPTPAVQAVADTLNGGGFASAPATAALETEGSVVAVPKEPPMGRSEIPAQGEARYQAMLERLRQGDTGSKDGIKIVGAIDPNVSVGAGAKGPVAKVQEVVQPKPQDLYPKDPIPLRIERTGDAVSVDSTPKALVIERGVVPSGHYVVLRIEPNPQGMLSALLMPLGGRQALDSAWVFVGDATSDGMVVENITRSIVVLRTPNGRNIQIALQ